MKMKIKPAPGLKIRDVDLRGFLPEEGREVQDTDYWIRLRAAGDVVDVTNQPDEGKPDQPEIKEPKASKK
jgi:Protein of unknown function (DUF2635)